ncbi:hypothetical protein MAR_013207 [Mya arenaria]|uniref:Uncharacterized protein n=1 Tax=Mya arenaria TaxID=6604 RepID=A0ABY7G2Z2_MYAAR|nr:hypothetical protein MAR_013207 [Mya arenaria]
MGTGSGTPPVGEDRHSILPTSSYCLPEIEHLRNCISFSKLKLKHDGGNLAISYQLHLTIVHLSVCLVSKPVLIALKIHAYESNSKDGNIDCQQTFKRLLFWMIN